MSLHQPCRDVTLAMASLKIFFTERATGSSRSPCSLVCLGRAFRIGFRLEDPALYTPSLTLILSLCLSSISPCPALLSPDAKLLCFCRLWARGRIIKVAWLHSCLVKPNFFSVGLYSRNVTSRNSGGKMVCTTSTYFDHAFESTGLS